MSRGNWKRKRRKKKNEIIPVEVWINSKFARNASFKVLTQKVNSELKIFERELARNVKLREKYHKRYISYINKNGSECYIQKHRLENVMHMISRITPKILFRMELYKVYMNYQGIFKGYIDVIPVGVWIEILKYFTDLSDIFAFMSTCKYFYNMVMENDYLWGFITKRKFSKIFTTFDHLIKKEKSWYKVMRYIQKTYLNPFRKKNNIDIALFKDCEGREFNIDEDNKTTYEKKARILLENRQSMDNQLFLKIKSYKNAKSKGAEYMKQETKKINKVLEESKSSRRLSQRLKYVPVSINQIEWFKEILNEKNKMKNTIVVYSSSAEDSDSDNKKIRRKKKKKRKKRRKTIRRSKKKLEVKKVVYLDENVNNLSFLSPLS